MTMVQLLELHKEVQHGAVDALEVHVGDDGHTQILNDAKLPFQTRRWS